MNTDRKSTPGWLGALCGAFVLALSALVWSSAWPVVAAERSELAAAPAPARTVTPTPAPRATVIATRRVGWLNSAAARAPQGLQRTFFIPYGGAGDGPGCERILLAPGAEAWVIDPLNIYVDVPHHCACLIAQYCGNMPDPNARFFLTDPAGYRRELPAGSDPTSVWYEFPATAAEGEYLLTIDTRSGLYEAMIGVHRFAGPRLTLRDAASLEPRLYYLPGQSVVAEYDQFEPGARLEVGLYRTDPDAGIETVLIDSWQVIVSETGRFVETLPISASALRTDYVLIACDSSSCAALFSRESNQVATTVFWEEFVITDDALVSSTAGTAWLTMWSSPSANTQVVRILRAGEAVRVLGGPTSILGQLWYRVEHTASGTQGWVLGQYLTAGGE